MYYRRMWTPKFQFHEDNSSVVLVEFFNCYTCGQVLRKELRIFIFLVVDVMRALWVFQSYGRFLYRRNSMSWNYSVKTVKYVNDLWYVERYEELIGNLIVIVRLMFIFLRVYPFLAHLLRRY